ncbi:MAG: response regulator [Fimbriimonadales bacterium]|nr:response regulator [Fimbriimonadales bacterium]
MRLVEQEPKTILLVEDNPDDERLAVRALNQCHMGVNLDVARDGAEAIEYFFGPNGLVHREGARYPMLVLLDLKLPKLSGFDVLERLRAHPATRRVPVVVLTLSDEEQDVRRAYELGANSYVRKPVNFERFVELVNQLLVYWFNVHTHTKPVP